MRVDVRSAEFGERRRSDELRLFSDPDIVYNTFLIENYIRNKIRCTSKECFTENIFQAN